MSLDVLNEVWTAEMAFLRDMYLLDADFLRFVWGLLQQPEAAGPATATLAVHAGTKVRAFVSRLCRACCASRACCSATMTSVAARVGECRRDVVAWWFDFCGRVFSL